MRSLDNEGEGVLHGSQPDLGCLGIGRGFESRSALWGITPQRWSVTSRRGRSATSRLSKAPDASANDCTPIKPDVTPAHVLTGGAAACLRHTNRVVVTCTNRRPAWFGRADARPFGPVSSTVELGAECPSVECSNPPRPISDHAVQGTAFRPGEPPGRARETRLAARAPYRRNDPGPLPGRDTRPGRGRRKRPFGSSVTGFHRTLRRGASGEFESSPSRPSRKGRPRSVCR